MFCDLLRVWSLGYPEVRGLGRRGHTCVKNLVGVEVCAKFGGDWSSGLHLKDGHRYIHRYKQSLLY